MPSPHPTERPNPTAPTAKQLALLRRLAHQASQSFSYPHTKAQASAEIHRLLAQVNADRCEQAIERRIEADRERDADPAADAARVREHETAGYGANAHWVHRHQDRGGRT